MAFSFSSFADEYEINDSQVDRAIASATEVSTQEINNFASVTLDAMTSGTVNAQSSAEATYRRSSRKNPWVAWALCWALGEFGIHRHYMGTSSGMWALYTCTCGGIFGLVPFVDWIVLLVGAIDGDIGDYCDNTSFLMWI
jgi:Predicted membrane protein